MAPQQTSLQTSTTGSQNNGTSNSTNGFNGSNIFGNNNRTANPEPNTNTTSNTNITANTNTTLIANTNTTSNANVSGSTLAFNASLIAQLATDSGAPTITSTTPVSGTTNVPITQVVTALFNESIRRNTVDSSTFLLKIGNTPVSGTVSLSPDNKTASFNPSLLTTSTTYTATITTGVKNLAGHSLPQNKTWSFTTTTITPPSPGSPFVTITDHIDGNDNDLSDGGTTDSDEMTFDYEASGGSSSSFDFTCSLDGESFKDCGSSATSGSHKYTGLDDGDHDFRVEATATNGGGSSDDTYEWTVDTFSDSLLPVASSSDFGSDSGSGSGSSPFSSTTGDNGPVSGTITNGNNITLEVPGYGNVTLVFENLTEAGSVTAQAIASTDGLSSLGIQYNSATGKYEVSVPMIKFILL